VANKSREYALTDLGNGERFVDQHHPDVRYCYEWDKWLIWDGRRWVIGDQAALTRRAHATVRSIYRETANTPDENRRINIAKHAVRSEATARVESMLQSAKPYLVVKPDELDQHSMYLNVSNGVIDLQTGELIPHNRDLMLTKLIDVPYHINAGYPEWEQFLDLVTGGDKELQLFLQVAVGYTLTGRTDEHALFFLYGVGQNGKTTFTEAIRRLMSDYAQRVDIEALLQSFSRGQAATPSVASMAGARLVLSSEIPESRKLNESLIKDLTGGDTMTARFLYSNPFTFEPTHKLWMFGNYKPRISGTDEGIWRRVRVIPFRVTIPNDVRKPMHEVIASFEAEMPGILAWAVAGCLLWQANGLRMVDAVKEATSEYRSDQDVVQQFLEDRCEMNADFTVEKNELYKAWQIWCESVGEKDASRKSKKWLTQQMTKRGFEHGGDGNRSLKGIKLTAT
jgi:putative DNA primase/helicase